MNNQARVIIAGDLFPVPANMESFSNGDVKTLFGDMLCQMFAEADLTICNMEGALTDRPECCKKIGPVLTMPTTVIEGYKKLGVDACMLANNHITDGGQHGVEDTSMLLSK